MLGMEQTVKIKKSRTEPIRFTISNKLNNSDRTPYWANRGWKRKGNQFRGRYFVNDKSYLGQMKESPSGRVDLFIKNPPVSKLRKHSHWECFHKKGKGWYFIHLNNGEDINITDGILGVERLLKETENL